MVRILARTTSVLPAAATSRSIPPPPAVPSVIPESKSTRAAPIAPPIVSASFSDVSTSAMCFSLPRDVACSLKPRP